MVRYIVDLYERHEGSDDPRAIQGGGGAYDERVVRIKGTKKRVGDYREAYFNRYGDELFAKYVGVA